MNSIRKLKELSSELRCMASYERSGFFMSDYPDSTLQHSDGGDLMRSQAKADDELLDNIRERIYMKQYSEAKDLIREEVQTAISQSNSLL
jgi:hypothetical protein